MNCLRDPEGLSLSNRPKLRRRSSSIRLMGWFSIWASSFVEIERRAETVESQDGSLRRYPG